MLPMSFDTSEVSKVLAAPGDISAIETVRLFRGTFSFDERCRVRGLTPAVVKQLPETGGGKPKWGFVPIGRLKPRKIFQAGPHWLNQI